MGPIRLGSEKVWVRFVLGPKRFGSESSQKFWVRVVSGPSCLTFIRRPSVVVHPSSSTISNGVSSEAVWPKLLIFGIKHPQKKGTKNVICSDRIRTLVAMATYTSHRLIMENKWKFLIGDI